MVSTGRFDDTFPLRKPALEVQRQPFADLDTTFEPLSPLDADSPLSSRRGSTSSCCTFPQSCCDDRSELADFTTEATASEIHFCPPEFRTVSRVASFASSGVLPEQASPSRQRFGRTSSWQQQQRRTREFLPSVFPDWVSEVDSEEEEEDSHRTLQPVASGSKDTLVWPPPAAPPRARRMESVDSQIATARQILRSSNLSENDEQMIAQIMHTLAFGTETREDQWAALDAAAADNDDPPEARAAARRSMMSQASTLLSEGGYTPALDLVIDWAQRYSTMTQLSQWKRVSRQTAASAAPAAVSSDAASSIYTKAEAGSFLDLEDLHDTRVRPSRTPSIHLPSLRSDSPFDAFGGALHQLQPPAWGPSVAERRSHRRQQQQPAETHHTSNPVVQPLRLRPQAKPVEAATAEPSSPPPPRGRAATSRWSDDSSRYAVAANSRKSPLLAPSTWRPLSTSHKHRRWASASTGPASHLPTIYAGSESSPKPTFSSSATSSPKTDSYVSSPKSSTNGEPWPKHRSLTSWLGFKGNSSSK